ncbi:unnamed protein product, partial [Mesorhabditis spiculigera]
MSDPAISVCADVPPPPLNGPLIHECVGNHREEGRGASFYRKNVKKALSSCNLDEPVKNPRQEGRGASSYRKKCKRTFRHESDLVPVQNFGKSRKTLMSGDNPRYCTLLPMTRGFKNIKIVESELLPNFFSIEPQ